MDSASLRRQSTEPNDAYLSACAGPMLLLRHSAHTSTSHLPDPSVKTLLRVPGAQIMGQGSWVQGGWLGYCRVCCLGMTISCMSWKEYQCGQKESKMVGNAKINSTLPYWGRETETQLQRRQQPHTGRMQKHSTCLGDLS